MLKSEDFDAWLANPVTQALRQRWAHRKREALKEQWANGEFSGTFNVEMAVKNAGATGAASILLEVEELDFESLIGEMDEGEFQRPETEGPRGPDPTV